MSSRANAYVALLGAVALALGTAATASASGSGGPSGGGGRSGGSSGGGGPSGGVGLSPGNPAALGLADSSLFIGGTIGVVSPGNVTVSDTQNSITLYAGASTTLGGELQITGQAPPGDAGQTIQIERLGHQTQWSWAPTAQAMIGSDGSFSATWDADHIGRFELGLALSSQAPSVGPVVMVTVFRPSIATWYNLFGHHTACGDRLTRETFGVANRTLACGERVALYYRGRTIVVPVIDRGPYGDGADWDLTEATGHALGMLADGRVTLGAVSLPRKP